MAGESHKTLLKKLEQKVRVLQQKEEKTLQQLQAALAKAHQLGRVYQKKLTTKIRFIKK